MILALGLLAGCGNDRTRPTGGLPMTADSGTADTGTTPPPTGDSGTEPPPVMSCTDECAAGTAPRCAGTGYQACERSSDGCYRWGTVAACGADQICEGGVCRGDSCPGGCCPRCDGSMCGAGSDGCGGTCACSGGAACSDTGSCCVPVPGSLACNEFLTAWCDRIVTCCTAPGSDCVEWAHSRSTCMGHFVSEGFNCADASWASMSICRDGVDRCVRDIPLVACSDFYIGTASLPASCGS
jgi:hypothetical protein